MATRGLVLLAKDTFSGVSTVSFDNVFSNTYKQYKIIFNALSSGSNSYSIRMRASGSDNSSTNYTRQYIVASSTSVTAGRSTTDTSWVISGSPTIKEISIVEILNPFQSTYTSGVVTYNYDSEANIGLVPNAYGMTVTTSYDGFTMFPAAGTTTGTITVYGLAQ